MKQLLGLCAVVFLWSTAGLRAAQPPPVSAEDERRLQAFAEERGSVRAYLRLAQLAAQRGDLESALATLRTTLELAPNSEEVLATYARIALAARSPVPAIVALEPLARMHPSVPEYPYLLGVARMQVGELLGAVVALKQSIQLEPRRALSHIALGLAHNKQKRYAEARDALGLGLELEPENLEAIAALAEAEEGLGDLAAAERHADRALKRASHHATANLALGMVRMKQSRYEEARTALERSVATDPDAAKTHYQLSLAYARLDDREASRRHLELYRNALKEVEDRLKALYGDTELKEGNASP